ncbi:hypothetical protein BaRGS_00003732 [Batillaria attramentaria]|uniref:Retrotransposon gag domain-containing protein n=1 Tax=Batillaria attramentaria TaxID=370345 RepID=A0ABD0M0K1_9CAEN
MAWDERTSIKNFGLFLEGEASSHYYDMSHEDRRSIASIFQNMAERFEPDETPETMRAVFTKMAQQSGEELREFAARVKKKIGPKAFQYCPSFVIEQECITKFISGLSNKKAAEGFSFHKFEHLKDAVEAVRLYLNRNCPESVVTKKVRYVEQAEGNGEAQFVRAVSKLSEISERFPNSQNSGTSTSNQSILQQTEKSLATLQKSLQMLKSGKGTF